MQIELAVKLKSIGCKVASKCSLPDFTLKTVSAVRSRSKENIGSKNENY